MLKLGAGGIVVLGHLAVLSWLADVVRLPSPIGLPQPTQWVKVSPVIEPPAIAAVSKPPSSASVPATSPAPRKSSANPSSSERQPHPADASLPQGQSAQAVNQDPADAERPPGQPIGEQAASAQSTPQLAESGGVASVATLAFGAPIPGPESVQLTYGVALGSQEDAAPIARLRFSLVIDGARYKMATEARAVGVTAWLYSGTMTQLSEGVIDQNGLVPLRFQEKRGTRSARNVEVDPLAGRIRLQDHREVDTLPGLQDRLSTVVQIGLVLRAIAELREPGQVVRFPEMTATGVAQVAYRNEGSEVLQFGGKTVDSLRLVRIASHAQEPQIEIWIAPSMQWLPVRIRLGDISGRSLDQRLEF